MNISAAFILLCLGAYLLGSVPFGFVFARFFCGRDPRLEGSKNVGATNVARLCGLPFGILTLICDALKGLLPTCLALSFYEPKAASLVGLCALVGHMYSVFLRFKGGKAVATTIGVFIALSLKSLIIAVTLCLTVIAITRYISLGSLTLAASLPIFLIIFERFDILSMAIIVALIIFFKHRENIIRLLRNEEKKFGKRS